MEAGRGLRDSLVKPPAQSRDSYSSGLDQGSCSKPLRWRLHNSFEQPFPLFDCPRGGSFPLRLVWTSVLAYVLCLLSSCHVPLRGAWFHLLGTLFILTWRAVLALSIPPATQSRVFSQLNKLIPPALPYRASVLLLILLVALHWSHCTLSTSFLYCRDQNWTLHTRCDIIVKGDLNNNLAVSKEKKKRQSQTTVNIPLRKKSLPNLL